MPDDSNKPSLSEMAVPQAFVQELSFKFPKDPAVIVGMKPAAGAWMDDERLYVQVVMAGTDKEGEKQLEAMCTVFTDKPAPELLEEAYPFMVAMCLARARAALQAATSFGNAEPLLLGPLSVEKQQAKLF
jgi:hypothetical protein